MLLRLILLPPNLAEYAAEGESGGGAGDPARGAAGDPARAGEPCAVQVDCEDTLTVHELACLLLTSYGQACGIAVKNPLWCQTAEGLLTLFAIRPGANTRVLLNARAQLPSSGLLAGMSVGLGYELAADGMARADPVRAVATVNSGGTVRRHVLQPGSNLIGSASACPVRVMDPGVPAVAACVNLLAHTAEILISGRGGAARAALAVGSAKHFRVGNSQLQIMLRSKWAQPSINYRSEIAHVPRARFLPLAPKPLQFSAPKHPDAATKPKLAMLPLVLPLLLGAALFLITKSSFSMVFLVLGPLLLLGNWIEKRRTQKKQNKKLMREFIAKLAEAEESLAEDRRNRLRYNKLLVADRTGFLSAEYPSAELPGSVWGRQRVSDASVLVATYEERSELAKFIGLDSDELRQRCNKKTAQLVLAAQNSLNSEITRCLKQPNTPYIFTLAGRQLALSGKDRLLVLNALVAQLTAQLPPTRLSIDVFPRGIGARLLQWLLVLPHSSLVNHGQEGAYEQRAGESWQHAEASRLRLIIASAAKEFEAVQRSLASLSDGEAATVVWVLETGEAAPAATDLLVDADTKQLIDFQRGKVLSLSELFTMETENALRFARQLAPLRDTARVSTGNGEIPSSIELAELLGLTVSSVKYLTSRSAGNLRDTDGRESKTCVPIGLMAGGVCELDLIAQGPHALIAGTTGAGKSEFLQSWLVAMAARLAPKHLNLVLIDYKGGATFGQLTELPHTVASVSDLTTAASERVLQSLRAEMLRREKLLATHRCKDINELCATAASVAPPLLVIAIDEFAVFIADLPNASQTIIDLAQRGRSLGVHLILAAQRPLGSISEKIQANLQIRVCFRVANKSDSREMLGDSTAFEIPAKYPGRGLLKLGNSEPIAFQAALVAEKTQQTKPATGRIRMPAAGLLDAVTVHAWPAAEKSAAERTRGQVKTSRLIAKIALESSDFVNTQPPVLLPQLPAVIALSEVRRYRKQEAKTGVAGGAEGADGAGELAGGAEGAGPASLADGDGMAVGVFDNPRAQQQLPYELSLPPGTALLISGARKTGKTSALITLIAALQQRPRINRVYWFGVERKQVAGLEKHPHVRSVTDFDDVWNCNRALAELTKLSGEQAQQIALLLDDFDTVLETMARRAATETIERLRATITRFLRNGGVAVATSSGGNRIAATMPNLFERFIYLRAADPLELRGRVDRETLEQLNRPGKFALPGQNITGQLALCCQPVGGADPRVTVEEQLTHLLTTAAKAASTNTSGRQLLARIPERLVQTEAMLRQGSIGVDLLTAEPVRLTAVKTVGVGVRDPLAKQAVIACLTNQLTVLTGRAARVETVKQQGAAAVEKQVDELCAAVSGGSAVVLDVSELQDAWAQQRVTDRCDYAFVHHAELRGDPLRGRPGVLQSLDSATAGALKSTPADSLIGVLTDNRGEAAGGQPGRKQRIVLLAHPARLDKPPQSPEPPRSLLNPHPLFDKQPLLKPLQRGNRNENTS